MKIFLFVILATLLIFLAPSSLYLRYGLYKRFYHDILEWHRPCDEQKTFDGISFYSRCKYCGKNIMQDSQGNWF